MEGPAHVVCVQDHHAYVGAGPDLVVLDASDPARPRQLGRVTLPYTVLDVGVAGDYAYVAAGPQGLHVVDVSDPFNPTLVGVYDALACAYTVAVSKSHAYVAAGPAGLHVVDVSNPTTPIQVGTLPISGAWTHHVTAAGHPSASSGQAHAYVAGYDYDADRVRWQVVDVSNPTAPAVLGARDLPGWAWGAAVAGDRVYVADGRRGGLRTLDVANPAAPTELGFYYPWERRVYDVAVAGSYVYLAAGPEGLRVLDVTDPAVVEVGYYNTPGDAVGVAVADGLVYVADGAGGLEVLRVAPSPVRPTPAATLVPTPTATPRTLTISPDEIEERIQRDGSAALPAIWRELGISDWISPSGRTRWGNQVERYHAELDGKTGAETMLKIPDIHDWNWRYLLFTKSGTDWKFLGHIDLWSEHYPPRQYRIVAIDERGIWLVLHAMQWTGTGMERIDEQWFAVGGAEPRLVLQYPSEGYVIGGWPYSNEFSREIVSCTRDGENYVVDVRFTISYATIWPDESPLFTTMRTARYVWRPTTRRFIFDSAESELSLGEVDTIDLDTFECPYCGNEEFLRRNFEEFIPLVMFGDSSQKRWLTQFLHGEIEWGDHKVEIEDTSEKRALLAILTSMP